MLAIYILGTLVLTAVLFVLALLAVGVLGQMGGQSVNNSAGLVFEVYRYTVCFVMVMLFGISAFIVVTSLIGGADSMALAGNGVAVLLSMAIFALHWRMKNPAAS